MMNPQEMIVINQLTKKYGIFTAVDSLDLSIPQGEIFGLLGPNGAGKTTTILMLLGLTEPTSGKASIQEYDSTKDTVKIKKIVGYLPDNVGFYKDMTARENLRYTARLNYIPDQEIEQKITDVLGKVGLLEVSDKRAGTYSRGMRQRLGIADLLIKDPAVLILDEPTLGLDPEGIRSILRMIENLAKEEGKTILISSHLLYQVEKICNRVGIFVEGKLLACGDIASLGKQILDNHSITLEVMVEPRDSSFVKAMESIPGVLNVIEKESMFEIISNERVQKHILRYVANNNYQILHLHEKGRDLDEIYQCYFSPKEGEHEQSV